MNELNFNFLKHEQVTHLDAEYQALQRSYNLETLFEYVQRYYHEPELLDSEPDISLDTKINYLLAIALFKLSYRGLAKHQSEGETSENHFNLLVNLKDGQKILPLNPDWLDNILALSRIYQHEHKHNHLKLPHYKPKRSQTMIFASLIVCGILEVVVCVILLLSKTNPWLGLGTLMGFGLVGVGVTGLKNHRHKFRQGVNHDLNCKDKVLKTLNHLQGLSLAPRLRENIRNLRPEPLLPIQTLANSRSVSAQTPNALVMYREVKTPRGVLLEPCIDNSPRSAALIQQLNRDNFS